MRNNRRDSIVSVVALAAVACAFAWPSLGEGASDVSTSQPAEAATPAVGPIAYYVAKCARCHGDVGAAYVGLEHPKSGKALEQVIDDMATGPGQAPLDAEGLKQQTALHEAMFGKMPFVWLDPTHTPGRVTGEVGPGTTLMFQGANGAADPRTVAITDNRFDFRGEHGLLLARRGNTVQHIRIR